MKFMLSAMMLLPVVAWATCFDEASSRYEVDVVLLKAIAWQESRGNPEAIGARLPDGNIALGEMQINTIHLPYLSKFGITRKDLFDACTSINLGAWVLANCIKEKGRTWRSVGCYVAGPKSKNEAAQKSYVSEVQKHYYALQKSPSKANGILDAAIISSNTSIVASSNKKNSLPALKKMMVWNSDE